MATIGDFMKQLEQVTTPEQAVAFVDSEAKRLCEEEERTDYANVRGIVLSNIGYFSGYYEPKRMAEIQQLFNTSHPIFGRYAPTPDEAFEAGTKVALLEAANG
jgi:hypothetical protein